MPTLDTKLDLKVSKEIKSKMNLTHYDTTFGQDDNHLLILDDHPTTFLQLHQTKPQPETTQPPPQPKTIQQQKQPDAAQQANAVYDPVSGAYLKCRELFKTVEKDTWTNSFANELGRLSQGYKINSIQGTNTLHFIPWNELLENKIPTYAQICCDYRLHKSEKKPHSHHSQRKQTSTHR